ncbi:MAG: ATP-dependent DNA helicase UvrD2, partial [Bacteroidetes bacterium]
MVLAPTGVAAINAGGTTIHSFFQLPFSPFIPVADHGSLPPPDAAETPADTHNAYSLIRRVRFNKDKRELLQSLELLIIDEISMVRADVLDAIDTLLRYFRYKPQLPFGGVQMLFIGDMFQLPPVVPNTDWEILHHYYASPFFFDSHAIKQDEPRNIELTKIYRQTDQQFIDALNQVRNNQMDEAGYNLLHSRYKPDFLPQKNQGYVTLCSHNAAADAINEDALAKLRGAAHTYNAEITGEFSEKSFPAEPRLQLKEGAQVMFIKNDLEKPRRFFNGKIGTITELTPDAVTVSCEGETASITIGQEEWTNVQYTLNRQQQRIEEKELGSFKQMPLRLAWAITIHKSQGLTFEKAVIDAGKAFAPGQVYVALSRCTSLQGLVLRTAIPASAIFTDPRIVAFGERTHASPQLEHQLLPAQITYQMELLALCFDGSSLIKAAQKLPAIISTYAAGFNAEALPWTEQMLEQCQVLADTGIKFTQQLAQLAQPNQLPQQNAAIQDRLPKAAAWFSPRLSGITDAIKKQPAVTDSKDQAQAYEEVLADLYKAAHQWLQLITACSQGFDAEQLLKARSKVQ